MAGDIPFHTYEVPMIFSRISVQKTLVLLPFFFPIKGNGYFCALVQSLLCPDSNGALMTGCCFSCFFKLSFCWILPPCMLAAQVSLLKQQNYFEFNFQFSPGLFTLLDPLPLRSCLHKQALELASQMKLYSLHPHPPHPPFPSPGKQLL